VPRRGPVGAGWGGAYPPARRRGERGDVDGHGRSVGSIEQRDPGLGLKRGLQLGRPLRSSQVRGRLTVLFVVLVVRAAGKGGGRRGVKAADALFFQRSSAYRPTV